MKIEQYQIAEIAVASGRFRPRRSQLLLQKSFVITTFYHKIS